MTNKTCGTCGHCTMIHDRYAAASCVCNITCMIDSGGYNCLRSVCSKTKPCGNYIERTDSLEQVALDMLAMIKAARKHPLALDPNKGSGGQIVYSLPEQEYFNRLRALGVEVSQ